MTQLKFKIKRKHSFFESNLFKIWMFAVLSLFLIVCSVNAQSIKQPISQSTTFDGATFEKYVTYLRLDGTQGVKMPITPQTIGRQLNYTVMLWYKPSADNWLKRYQYAFEIANQLSCYFTDGGYLMCDSNKNSEKLILDVKTLVDPNRWNHLTLSGLVSQTSYVLLETNSDFVAQDRRLYLNLQQDSKDSWQACLGGCDGIYGFQGGLRDFVILNKYLTQDSAQRMKNQLLSYDSTILAYYRFTEDDFLEDVYRQNQAAVVATKLNIKIKDSDIIPNDICSPFNNTLLAHQFSAKSILNDLKPINIDGRWKPQSKDWGYSLSLWLYVNSDSCARSSPSDAQKSCFIVNLQEAFMIFFSDYNLVSGYFFNTKPFYESQTKNIYVPKSSWVNIQMGATQNQGYEIMSVDVLGRVIDYEFQSKDLQEQNVKNKIFQIGKGFSGFIRQVYLTSKRMAFPIQTPSAQLRPSPIFAFNQSDCIIYYKFDYESIVNDSYAVDYCKNSQHAYFNGQPNLVGTQIAQFNMKSGQKFGLITSDQDLFDGIACNDGSMVSQFQYDTSLIMAKTPRVTKNILNATVEFWARVTQPVNKTNYLFTLWGNNTRKEYMSIFYDTKNILICAPFGRDSVQSPFLAYRSFNQSTFDQLDQQGGGWLHIVCQFDQSVEKEATGFIHQNTLQMDEEITLDLDNAKGAGLMIPSDSFEVYLGNNRLGQKGTAGLQLREVRVWALKRSILEIKLWRYRVLDPRQYTLQQLLSYISLDEGSYNIYNSVWFISNLVDQKVNRFRDIKHVSDASLIVCPINTYYSANYSECYQDPVQDLIGAIYPQVQDNGKIEWIFDSSATQILSSDFQDSIITQWQFTDPVVKSLVKLQSNPKLTSTKLILPSESMISEKPYEVILNVSNTDLTFNRVQVKKFVPTPCFFMVFNQTNSPLQYLNYTVPQSTDDIVISLKPFMTNSYCSSTAFYNKVMPDLEYQISPQLENEPNLIISFDFISRQFQILLPWQEQYKIPLQTDFQIIFNFKWSNTNYEVDTSDLSFANAVFTVKFTTQGQIVIPDLRSNKAVILKGEYAELDASNSYILYAPANESQKGIEFSWVCPTGLQQLCLNKKSSILNISGSTFPGPFNKSLAFTVQLKWQRLNSQGQTISSIFEEKIQITFLNQSIPSFQLFGPASVKTTADNQRFYIVMDYFASVNASQISVQWSIVPNLTSQLNLTANNSVLTVPKNGFAQQTTYTITVFTQLREMEGISRSQQLIFTTPKVPWGGSITMTPQIGIVLETNFTVALIGWQSLNRPIRYRVYSTLNGFGTILGPLVGSQTWLLDSQTNTFSAPNTYPFQIEITDQSGETVMVRISPTVTDKPSDDFSGNLLIDLNKISGKTLSPLTVNQKYKTMNSIVTKINESPTSQSVNVSPVQTITTQEQLSSRGIVVQQVLKDLNEVNGSSSSNSDLVIQQSSKILSMITASPQYIDTYIAQSVVSGLNIIVNSGKLSQSANKDVAQALSNLFKYSTSSFSNRRMLQPIENMTAFQDQLFNLKDDLVNQICSSLQTGEESIIQTEMFEMIVRKITTNDQNEMITILSVQYSIDVDSARLTQSVTKINADSLCLMPTYFNLNSTIFSQPTSDDIQVPTTFLDIQTSPSIRSNLQDFLQIKFDEDFVMNQTLCAVFSQPLKQWNCEACQTQYDLSHNEVLCSCNLIDSNFIGLINDKSRIAGQIVKKQDVNDEKSKASSYNSEPISQSTSFAYIGVILLLLINAIVVPIIAYSQDKRDYVHLTTQKVADEQNQLLNALSKNSNLPYSYWFYQRESVLSYLQKNKPFLSHLIHEVHPILNIFTSFDPTQSRLSRFIAYYFQISAFALVSVFVFGPSYRSGDDDNMFRINENGLDEKDIDWILSVGCIGMIVLLPVPFLNGTLKNRDTKSNQMIKIQTAGNSFEQNQNDKVKLSSFVSFKSFLNKPLHLILSGLSIVFTLSTIVLVLIYSTQIPVSNQYCLVSAFYLGYFGGMFFSNMARVLFNAMIVPQCSSNSIGGNILLSAQALRIKNEIQYVREAEQELLSSKSFRQSLREIEDHNDNIGPNQNLTFQANENEKANQSKFNQEEVSVFNQCTQEHISKYQQVSEECLTHVASLCRQSNIKSPNKLSNQFFTDNNDSPNIKQSKLKISIKQQVDDDQIGLSKADISQLTGQ